MISPGLGEQGGGHQNPTGHAAGELEGVEALCLLRKTQLAEERPARFRGPRLPVAICLGAHLHQGVQEGDGLGYQGDFGSSEPGLPLWGQGFSVKLQGAGYGGVARQNAQNGGGQ